MNRNDQTLAGAILETVRLPLLAIDGAMRVEAANEAFLRHFRVDRAETVGRLVYDLGNGQWDIPELRRLLGEILPREASITDYRVEHEFERIGRRVMHLDARRIARSDAPDLVLLAISDDTEREALHAELAGRIELADKLIDSVREGLLILRPDLRVHSASRSFYDIFGVEPADTAGRLVYELGNGQWDIPELRRLLQDVLPHRSSFDNYEVTHTFEGIGRRVMMLNGRRLDHMDLILLAVRDVTEARESAARLRAVAAAAHVGVFEADHRAGTLHWSPEMRDIVGFPQDARPPPAGVVPDFVHRDDRAAVEEMFRAVLDPSGDGVILHEHRIVRPDGAVRWVEMRGRVDFALIDGERRPANLHGVLVDVTQKRAAEEALRDSEERQRFLLRLGDALRPLSNPDDVIGTATRLLGERLGASRAYFVEWPSGEAYGEVVRDHVAPGLPSLAGRYPVDAFRTTYDRIALGRTWIVGDATSETGIDAAERSRYAELGVVAWIDVPLIKDGRPLAVLCVVQDRPRAWTPLEIDLVEETADRCWTALERARAEAQLRESEERFRQFGDAASDLLWVRDAATLDWEYLSPAFERTYGLDREAALSGNGLRTWMEVIHPEDRDRVAAEIERVRRGESTMFEYRITRPSDGELRWLRNTDFPLTTAEGTVQRIGGIGHDATDEKRTAERMEVLVAELQHRTRNLIAVIRAIARQTMAATGPGAAFQAEFEHRLGALARVQGLLSRASEEPITLRALIRMELDALGADARRGRIHLDGPSVPLRNSLVQTLALALHELATNARKYGALSSESGRLEVRWRRVDGDRRLLLEWEETGGRPPNDAVEAGHGYGRQLIERALPYALQATTTFEHDAAGLRCTIDMPLGRPQEQGS